MKALVANDREAFYRSEIEARERAGYPPFGRLASLIVSAGDRPTAEGFARRLAAVFAKIGAPSPIAFIARTGELTPPGISPRARA